MSWDRLLEAARSGRLYPAVILYGSDDEGRRARALELVRTLLCDETAPRRPCGTCRHCRRLGEPNLHPDLHHLERDLRTSTSVAATRAFLKDAALAPYEARGQVFLVGAADSLTPGAADALLKVLEEPPGVSPRHFLLLAASRLDLSATLRSRSLSVFLGGETPLERDAVESLAGRLGPCLDGYWATGQPVYLLAAASAIEAEGDWQDPRAQRPWGVAAAALLLAAAERPPELRRRLLELGEALLDGPTLRLRGIPAGRILEGLWAREVGSLPVALRSRGGGR